MLAELSRAMTQKAYAADLDPEGEAALAGRRIPASAGEGSVRPGEAGVGGAGWPGPRRPRPREERLAGSWQLAAARRLPFAACGTSGLGCTQILSFTAVVGPVSGARGSRRSRPSGRSGLGPAPEAAVRDLAGGPASDRRAAARGRAGGRPGPAEGCCSGGRRASGVTSFTPILCLLGAGSRSVTDVPMKFHLRICRPPALTDDLHPF
jgi:hypothetical protein